MSNQGFGFSSNDDDDERKDDNQNNPNNPFGMFGFPLGGFGFGGQPGGNAGNGDQQGGPNGPGGLGDILNQFGQMLSGFSQQMDNPQGGAVDHGAAERIALQKIGNPAPIRESQRTALTDSLRLVELWLDDSTVLPVGADRAEGWNTRQWLENTMPTWKRVVDPVASKMNDASLAGLPEEARQMMGPMLGMLNRVNSMNFGAQLGNALSDLAKSSLTGSDLGLPLTMSGAAVLLPTNITALAEELEQPNRELTVYLTAREAAHQRLFHRVPWLAERMIAAIEEYANGLTMDFSSIEEAARGFDLESLQDPSKIQEAMQSFQNIDMTPKVTSSNQHARTRLETMLALVEGWVDVVVMDSLGERLPDAMQIDEAWRRRRATDGAQKALEKATGIDLAAPKTREAGVLWRRLTDAVGIERRDAVWDHPDFLPVADDLDNPASFIDGILGSADNDDFDPIAALEEQLRKEAEEGRDAPDDDDNK
ncbi:zinc-dependent metalloprotease [Corynebacterium sputi]|uniref:zinc-dependent metalloprotease n=1 Tax=Corynebacterium sputi TaxID=489915 RepID=UPI0003FB4A91|nr:zinc-dependent metalloprotease [Corynebacterium sputi]